MSITTEAVEHMARLARLTLEPDEPERMAAQLAAILAHVRELDEVDLDGVEPFEIAAEHAAGARADEPGAEPLVLPLAEMATAMRAGFFTVPRLYEPGPGEPE